MKAHNRNFVTFILVLFGMLVSFGYTTAAEKAQGKITKIGIESLNMGIASDNTGLKRSSIYLAGIHEIDESTKTLIEQYQKEDNDNTKILIALALYKIGNEEGIEAIEKYSVNDKNPEVRRIGKAILNQLAVEETTSVSVK